MHLISCFVGGLAVVAALAPALAASPSGVASTLAEVQIELCSPFPDIERSLKLRPDGDPIEVWLFDDAALSLFERGVRIRLRVKGKHTEFTVKVANQDCARIDAKLVPPKAGKCEIDVHGTSMSGTVSLSRNLSHKEWTDLVAGRAAAADLLSPVQAAYLRDTAKVWPLPAQLRALGPKQARSYVMADKSHEVDVSKLPSGEQYVEMSHRVPAANALRAKDELDTMLKRAGVKACEDQAGQANNKLKRMLR
jgi:hypothetical protein